MKILYLILNSWFKRTTIRILPCLWRGDCSRWGQAVPPLQWPLPVRQVRVGPRRGGQEQGSGLSVSAQLGYTSTPLMRDPSKTMVKSWMVCRMRMRELTVMRSRRRALSSYIRVMAGHSAKSGIHCGSRRSLRAQTETSPEHGWRLALPWNKAHTGAFHGKVWASSAERKPKSRRWVFTG